MDKIISVKGLSKNFNSFPAVKDISFEVDDGEIFAFLGPNGAGKSTTIKMLITLLKPAAGDAAINGQSVIHHPAQVRKMIGYVPQMISVDGALTVEENMLLMAGLYDVPRRECKGRIRQMLEFLGLAGNAGSLVRTLSGGMIRKLEIGQAMLHRPRLLFLDEPTTGVDPIAKRNIWEHLGRLRKDFGTTIFFSTHNLEEAEVSCDRVAIMNKGQIAAIGSVSRLKEESGQATLEGAFIFFAGDSLEANGNFRDIKQTRKTQRRLG
ncbi:MAG: ATP-binding cassette domain-containing protein [Candidatus Omnitrophica bacterium]|nr:ATP-binding cassette domain-containing protein [Candidatus Omnitrophota bacterium]MDE2009280.1 ATP-binding cassette domain-containing protein [Candidatus Omnitrophota bacterium]MDE2213800.1 ATP-binding cassette domain-containing protein [Candidatus Omnitrophota bacterium]